MELQEPRSQSRVTITAHRSIRPAVILLNETWLLPSSPLRITNYENLRDDRNDGYGGVAILVRRGIPFTPDSLPPITSTNSVILSASAIKTDIPLRSTIIGIVYIPPDARIPTSEFESFINNLPKSLILIGDFNAKSSAWYCQSNNNLGKHLLTATQDSDLILLNDNTPTHFDSRHWTENVLDLAFASLHSPSLLSGEFTTSSVAAITTPLFFRYQVPIHILQNRETSHKSTGHPFLHAWKNTLTKFKILEIHRSILLRTQRLFTPSSSQELDVKENSSTLV